MKYPKKRIPLYMIIRSYIISEVSLDDCCKGLSAFISSRYRRRDRRTERDVKLMRFSRECA